MSSTVENRRHPRIPLNWPVVLITPQGTIKGETGNLSVGGALILCSEIPEVGDEFQITLKSSSDHEMFVTCEKAWASTFNTNGSTLCGMGVRFTKLSATDHEFISALVQEYII